MRGDFIQLAELIHNWPCIVKGSIREEICGICEHHSKCQKGMLFCARKGERFDGVKYVHEAIKKGASCIVVEEEQYFDNVKLSVPLVWVPNIKQFIAYASSAINGHPSEALKVVAVTGTNGKTSTTTFVYQLLTACQKKCVLIGTNGVQMNGEPIEHSFENLTTETPIALHTFMKEAVKKDYEIIIMEASSQGLAQHRLDYANIDIGVFLNLGEDHIEWHGSLEKYKQAKARLEKLADTIIINYNDIYSRSIGLLSKKNSFQFGMHPKCQLFYEECYPLHSGQYLLQYKDEQSFVRFPFQQHFMIENAVAAISVALNLGIDFQTIARLVEQLKFPKGRCQTFEHPSGVQIVVDYAHTADAFENLLSAFPLEREKGIIVFSCGGNRDHAKRKKMGDVASRYCQKIILTTDNARDEDPVAINEEIIKGFVKDQIVECQMILNREEAIRTAIEQSKNGDTIFVLGKGHEDYQIIGDEVFHFSDIEVVQSIIGKDCS